jgi:hypothetical protein
MKDKKNFQGLDPKKKHFETLSRFFLVLFIFANFILFLFIFTRQKPLTLFLSQKAFYVNLIFSFYND